ncbi:hypothetical protein Ocin01_09438 [Orchesella cincta]|uniref:Uncharacterized protein n=1 Tax=Orchesella cincta TaxID=48709 RepID=A0A1D2MX28_ORCCI|nr:hypothetical protein Ocin01_09438 [Orchesella cincta]
MRYGESIFYCRVQLFFQPGRSVRLDKMFPGNEEMQVVGAVDASAKAIFNSSKVHIDDETGDPVNFHISSWGKIVILGSIKRLAMTQGINPEVNPSALNWAVVFREVYERTAERLRFAVTQDNIIKYFQNRMYIYTQYFPDFHQHESAIDQLIRVYAINFLKEGNARNTNAAYLNSNYYYCEHSQGAGAGAQNLDSNPNASDHHLPGSIGDMEQGWCMNQYPQTTGGVAAVNVNPYPTFSATTTTGPIEGECSQTRSKTTRSSARAGVSSTATRPGPITETGVHSTVITGVGVSTIHNATATTSAAPANKTGKPATITNGAANASTLTNNRNGVTTPTNETGKPATSTNGAATTSVAPAVTPKRGRAGVATNAATSSKTTVASRTRNGKFVTTTNTKTTSTTNVCDLNELPFSFKCNGITSVVIEHNISNSQEPGVVVTDASPPHFQPRRIKRKYVDEEKQQKANSAKQSTLEPVPTSASEKEAIKLALLTVMKQFSEEGSSLLRMSTSLACKASEGRKQLLPYTFPGIEEQISNGEIADIKSLVGHLQSLLILFLLDGNKNEIPDAMVSLLKQFKEASLHDPPNATCKDHVIRLPFNILLLIFRACELLRNMNSPTPVKIMNEDRTINELPFFINSTRLRRAESYFEIGRSVSEVRKFLEKKRASSDSTEDSEPQGEVGYYGVQQFIQLDEEDADGDEIDEAGVNDDLDGVDEDTEYEKATTFSLFWTTMKKLAMSLGCSRHTFIEKPRINFDLESQVSSPQTDQTEISDVAVASESNFNQTSRVDTNANLNFELDPRVRQDGVIVYRDRNYLMQKLRMDLGWGSFDVLMFSVTLPTESQESTDLQSFVISRDCGSFLWAEDGKASAIFMSGCSEVFIGNIMDWFLKVLSDMALADSVMIGHPYYWQPTVRRRLQRVMKYLKRLYRNLAIREKRHPKPSLATGSIRTDVVEILCPTDISKVVINEQPSHNLTHTRSADVQLHTMLEQLVGKWFDYQRSVKISPSETAQDISNTYNITHPGRCRGKGEFLESVTFLDFFPHNRIKLHPEDPAPSPPCEVIMSTQVQRKNSYVQEQINEEGLLVAKTGAGVVPEIPEYQTSLRRGEVASEILDPSTATSTDKDEDSRMSRGETLSEVIVTHEKQTKPHPIRQKHGPLT